MPTPLVDAIDIRRDATQARERRLRPYLRLAFIAAWRHREARRRMLHAVRELDHAGVLEDVRFACGPFHR